MILNRRRFTFATHTHTHTHPHAPQGDLLRSEAADAAKAATGLGAALIERFMRRAPTIESDWEFTFWSVTTVCRTDPALAKRWVPVLFAKLLDVMTRPPTNGA